MEIELTFEQTFEIERMGRLIDETEDAATLQNMCKLLLRSWMNQKAATAWVMRQKGSGITADYSGAAREIKP